MKMNYSANTTACQAVSRDKKTHRLIPLGRFLFGAGIFVLVLRAITETSRVPGLPAFWYSNQPLWFITSFGMIGLGWKILWGSTEISLNGWRPAKPGIRFQSGVVYVGEGCHLCDDAIEILKAYQQWLPQFDLIDIQSDPDLAKQFGTCIPVVVLDGKIRFRGRISEPLLQRLIEGTLPAS